MERQGLDCLILVLAEGPWAPDAEYLVGHDLAMRGLGLFPAAAEAIAFVDPCGAALGSHHWVAAVQHPPGDLHTALIERLREVALPNGRVGVVGQSAPERLGVTEVSHALHTALHRGLPRVDLVPFATEIQTLRAVKSEAEIALLTRSARWIDRAFERAAAGARPGKRDYEVAAAAVAELIRSGSGPSIASRWGSGPRPRLYARPGHGLLQRGSVIAAELEACSDGYRTRGIRAIAIDDCDPVLKDLCPMLADYWHACVWSLEAGRTIEEIKERCGVAASRLIPKEGRYAQVVLSAAFVGQGLGQDWPSPFDPVCDARDSRQVVQERSVLSVQTTLELPTQGRSYRIVWSDPVVLRPTRPQRLGTHTPGLMMTEAD